MAPIADPPLNSPHWWEQYLRDSWDRNGGAAQTRHFMQRLLAELPAQVRARLQRDGTSILDWGCAHGEGVDELAQAFPRATIVGLDVAPSAVAEAQRRFPHQHFRHSPEHAGVPPADVVISSNCLEHFAEPLAVARRLGDAARSLLILLVPYAEEPLCPSHVVRFDEQSFPAQLGALRRIACKRIPVDARHWGGEQLLVVYATAAFAAPTGEDPADPERARWDQHYATSALQEESEPMARFGAEFAAAVSALLPAGGRVLEAGCGAGWHALALARTGRFAVTLLDYSEHALRHARAQFARSGLPAEFRLGDAREHGTPEFDLVFNSGVLEHFEREQQIAFLQAMASRSRNLVLTLVPNRSCYWYWIWRLEAAAHGDWPFGREVAVRELGSVFAAAGLHPRGERVLGADWTESFLPYLRGLEPPLREALATAHRSPLLPMRTKGYLLATLGSVVPGAAVSADGWELDAAAEPPGVPALAAALADALALQVRAQREQQELRTQHAQLRTAQTDAELRASRDAATAAQLQQQLTETGAREEAARQELATAAAALQQLQAQLEQAREEATQQAGQRQHLQDSLRSAQLQAARTTRELEDLARAHGELVAWREMVERSRTFRWLRRIDGVRARIRRR